MMRRCTSALVVALFAATLHAQEYVRYLMPLAPDEKRGAFGSLWNTSFQVLNDSPEPLVLGQDLLPWPGCPLIVCGNTLGPGETRSYLLWPTPLPSPGMLYYVRSEIHEHVDLASFVVEVTSGSLPTQVPVVSESEFLTRPTNLLGLAPSNDRFRTRLRLYDPDANVGGAIRVSAYYAVSPVLLGERIIPLTVPLERLGDRVVFSGYAEVEIDLSFLTAVPGVNPDVPLRLKLEPLAPTTRYWAMVSLTRNDTNQVMLITPDP